MSSCPDQVCGKKYAYPIQAIRATKRKIRVNAVAQPKWAPGQKIYCNRLKNSIYGFKRSVWKSKKKVELQVLKKN